MSIDRPARPIPAPDTGHGPAAALLLTMAIGAVLLGVVALRPAAVLALDASAVPSASVDPSASPSPAPSDSPTPTASPTPTPSPTPAPTPTPTPYPWPTTVTTLGPSVTFYGGGYGHGVGLNQYGARGRALAGQTADQILAAYFKGSAPSTTSPTRAVRVLILAAYPSASTAPLTVYGRGGTWSIDRVAAVFPADARARVWRTTATINGVATTVWHLRVLAADGTTLLPTTTVSSSLTIRPATATSRLQLWSKPSSYDTYRGTFTVLLKASSAYVVNRLGLDDYLRGVVPVEMPSSWPVEALRAQAVTCRSYALRRLHPSTGSYDLYDDTRSQVYRGVEAEKAVTNALIDASPGAILVSGTSVVNAFYFSTGGGATENNEYAFVGSSGAVTSSPVSYLRGIVDRAADGSAFDAVAPYFRWTTSTLTRAQLSAMFATDARTSVGDVLRLDLRRRGVSGRLYRVTLYGSTATKTVSADVFRSVYNASRPAGTLLLRSNLFNVAPLP